MRVLVDTHVFFWWVTDDNKLSNLAREAIADETNEVLVSAVVGWELANKVRLSKWPEAVELANKVRLSKWPEAVELANNVDRHIRDNFFTSLSITMEHARVAGFLPARHRDPFDRMLAAQSTVEAIPLLSADPAFRELGARVVW